MYYEDPWDDNGGLVIDLQPGLQHLNGKTAIQYVRYHDAKAIRSYKSSAKIHESFPCTCTSTLFKLQF